MLKAHKTKLKHRLEIENSRNIPGNYYSHTQLLLESDQHQSGSPTEIRTRTPQSVKHSKLALSQSVSKMRL